MSVKNDARGNEGNSGSGQEGRSSQLSRSFGAKKSSNSEGELYFRSGGRSNLSKWRERMHQNAMQEFGELGDVLMTEQYVIFDEPIYPENGTNQEKALFTLLSKDWMERIKTQRDNKPKLWAYLWQNMSEDSKARVLTRGYSDLNRDPLDLWNAIKVAHVGDGSGDAEMDKLSAENNFENMRQFEDEGIVEFKRRFDDCVTALVSAGVPKYDEAKLAREFYDKLSNIKFAKFKDRLSDLVLLGEATRPATLQAMYELAANYYRRNPEKARVAPTSTVFAANDNNNKGGLNGGTEYGSGGNARGKRGNDGEHPREYYFHPGTNRARMPSKYSPCGICKSPNHWYKQCDGSGPGKDVGNVGALAEKVTIFFDSILAATNPDMIAGVTPSVLEGVMLLDTQATNHLFRDECLLERVEPGKKRVFEGVGGALVVTKSGIHADFGRVFVHPRAPANILSFARVQDACLVEYVNGMFVVTTQDMHVYVFVRENNMYTCKVNKETSLVTVAENEGRYSLREVKAAKQAKELIRRLCYPSLDSIQKMINNNAIMNCPVTSQDIERAVDIYGTELAYLKGKTTKQRSVQVSRESRLLISRNQALHVDIMFINKEAYLLSVSTPLGLLSANHLGAAAGAKSARMVKIALLHQMSVYESYGQKVSDILTDGEGAIAAIVADLAKLAVVVNTAGPGEHVPLVERKIRQVKERVRGVVNTLPYRLANPLLRWLVAFAVTRINLLPTKTGKIGVSPKEALTGRKVDYNRDVRVGFGDYVQATTRTTDNSLKGRTEGAIALCPTMNTQGSCTFMLLRNLETAVRDHWTVLPTPVEVIQRMNEYADKTGHAVSEGVEFRRGEVLIVEVEEIVVEGEVVEGEGGIASTVEISEVDDRGGVIAEDLPNTRITFNEAMGQPLATEDAGDRMVQSGVSNGSVEGRTDRLEIEGPIGDRTDFPVVGTELGTEEESEWDENRRGNQIDSEEQAHDAAASIFGRLTGDTDVPVNPGMLDHAVADDAGPDGDAALPLPPAAPEPVYRYGTRSRARQEQGGERLMMLEEEWDEGRDEEVMAHDYAFNMTVKEAMVKVGDKAKEAVMDEMKQMRDRGVFELVTLSEMSESDKRSIIRSKLFLKEKFLPDGSLDKLKARLVAGGHMQDRSLWPDLSSPTACTTAIFATAALAAKERRHVVTLDIGSAYLNADMEGRKVYMRLDKYCTDAYLELCPHARAYSNDDGTMVVILRKALYGCIQSSKLWYKHLRSALVSIGCKCNAYDMCVYNLNEGNKQVTLTLHVDDLFISSACQLELERVINLIEEKYKTVKINRGLVHDYLGMRFDFTLPLQCQVSMSGFIDSLLEGEKVVEKSVSPATEMLHSVRQEGVVKLEGEEKEWFHSTVAKLLYLSKRVRNDILVAVSFLTTRIVGPDSDDRSKLVRVLSYLNNTRDIGMVLECSEEVRVTAFIDASYGVLPGHRSVSGCMITLGKGPIYAKCSKQRIVSKSSTEAELVALSDCSSMAIWVRNFLLEQGYETPEVLIYQDNKSTIAMLKAGSGSSALSRHINARYFWLLWYVDNLQVIIEYMPTADMVSDVLTKPLQGEHFRRLRGLLLNC